MEGEEYLFSSIDKPKGLLAAELALPSPCSDLPVLTGKACGMVVVP